MKNSYRVSGPRPVLDVEPGEILEHEFPAQEELDLLRTGRLVLVPRSYQVVGSRQVFGFLPGSFLEAALTVGQEDALISAGHIERADKPVSKSKQKEL